MTALRDQIAALLTRLWGQKQPQTPRAAQELTPLRKVQEDLRIDFFGRTFQEGDEVNFSGMKDDWNAVDQATHSKYPNQPRLGQLFRWRRRPRGLPGPPGYLKAQGEGWRELRERVKDAGATEVWVFIYLHKLNHALEVKLNLTLPAEWA